LRSYTLDFVGRKKKQTLLRRPGQKAGIDDPIQLDDKGVNRTRWQIEQYVRDRT
jgi:hypothetical protein